MTQNGETPQSQRFDSLLARSGWSRARLAEALADDYSAYEGILNGDQQPSLVDATFLAALLCVSVSEVLYGPRKTTAIVCSDTGCQKWTS